MKKIALFILGLLAILYIKKRVVGETRTTKNGVEFAEVGYFKELGAMGNESVWNEITEYGRKINVGPR